MRAQRLQRGLGRFRLVAADGGLDQLRQHVDQPADPGYRSPERCAADSASG